MHQSSSEQWQRYFHSLRISRIATHVRFLFLFRSRSEKTTRDSFVQQRRCYIIIQFVKLNFLSSMPATVSCSLHRQPSPASSLCLGRWADFLHKIAGIRSMKKKKTMVNCFASNGPRNHLLSSLCRLRLVAAIAKICISMKFEPIWPYATQLLVRIRKKEKKKRRLNFIFVALVFHSCFRGVRAHDTCAPFPPANRSWRYPVRFELQTMHFGHDELHKH